MEDLFRFAQIRPAHRLAHEVHSIELGTVSDFQTSLADTNPPERAKRREMAEAFAETDDFVDAGGGTPFIEKMEAIAGKVDLALADPSATLTPAKFDMILAGALGQDAAEFVADADTQKQLVALKDSLVSRIKCNTFRTYP